MLSFSLPSESSGNTPLTSEQVTTLDRLPLLDAVLRETLRMYPPVQNNLRLATHDTSVPVAKPFVDAKGTVHDSIQMSEGDMFFMPSYLINRTPELFGADAGEWKYVEALFLDPFMLITAI
jgi:cytochrome P450